MENSSIEKSKLQVSKEIYYKMVYASYNYLNYMWKEEKKKNISMKEMLKDKFCVDFSYKGIRKEKKDFDAFMFYMIKENLDIDPTPYYNKCPEDIIDWYYELCYLINNNGNKTSEEALNYILCGLYIDPLIKEIPNENNHLYDFMNKKLFDYIVAVDLFIIENSPNFPSNLSVIFFDQCEEEFKIGLRK